MSNVAIHVEGLGKDFRIGARQKTSYGTLRDTIVDSLTAPFLRAGRLIRGEATGAAELTETLSALQDIYLDITQGEVVGLIGRNGAGKSTLLKVLSRITEPTRGFADIAGRIGTLLEVGTGFHPELTGRENTYLNGAILGMKKEEIHRKFDQIVAFAGVEKFIDTPVKHYSTGMSVRLAFAVAAHLDPEILMVDEVLAVGDASFQKKCLGVMGEIGRSGRTVILVSHNMAAIENLCSRAIWIDSGRIRGDGDPCKVIEEYLKTYAMAEETGFDFSDVRKRDGSGAVKFSRVEFLDKSGKPKQLIRSGDGVTLRLHFLSRKTVPEPHFGIDVFTEFGTKVTTLHTWMTGFSIPYLNEGEGYIDVVVDFLNLMPGRYYLSLQLEGVGPVHYDILDRCAYFDVEASDFYKSGRGIEGRYGIVFLPCQWKLKSKPEEAEFNTCFADD